MPPKKAPQAAMSSCDVENVYREWKDQRAVREVAISTDRLFISHKGPEESLKFTIKDSVRNQHMIMPLLHRMAQDPAHPLPTVKSLARETLGIILENFVIFIWECWWPGRVAVVEVNMDRK